MIYLSTKPEMQPISMAISRFNGIHSTNPALVDDELRRITDYNTQRAKELQALCDTHARALLFELGVDLIPFAKL